MTQTQKENVPKLRFPEFEGRWTKSRFGELIEIASGQVDPKHEPYASMPHVAPDNIKSGTGTLMKVRSAREDGMKSGKYSFDEHALVYSKIRPNLNKVARPKFSGICSADMYPIWGKVDVSDTDFLLQLMLGERFVSAATAVSLRTGLPKINRPDLNAIKTASPSLPEQRKIASFLGAVDEKIAHLSRKKALLEDYKKGCVQQLFSQKIRFKDNDGNNFPDWEEKRLDDLIRDGYIELGRGKVISKNDLAGTPGNYPVFSSSAAGDGEFGRYGNFMFDEPLITWSIDGGGHLFLREAQKFSVTNVSGYLRILNDRLVYGFVFSCLKLQHERLAFDYQTKAHPSVIRKMYNVSLPHPAEQRKIADFLSALDRKIDLVAQEVTHAHSFKAGLLQQMFV
ncbi:restriction endonuclease subunit S (plasmid) [Sulfitobacter sp. S223]|uniref:restriction endonuclease subunit S n=1 Tax=Sulfitobacter sp. S223 TaxID=2867023 RepID=UPI0021A32038|nr:restriction endonuclease subunit S [Sulfitobacter sp. S223]UWR28304.1 restriction endonuclease subunit S [Sulfitobacter sp. S223]